MSVRVDPGALVVHSPSGFFAFRTPLLPFDAFLAWGEGLTACKALESGASLEEALAADRILQRGRLRDALNEPELLEAVFLASPDLHDTLGLWLSDPEGDRGQRAERAVVKYFSRAAGRATPFGLFAGASVGRIAATTRLELAGRERCRRHSRLDMDYLFTLADTLARDASRRVDFLLKPNSSLYESAGRFRYVESRLKGEDRTYHLVALEDSPVLRETLERAAHGARIRELAAALVGSDVSLEEAEEYVGQLVDAQILVPEIGLVITGQEPTAFMATRLAEGAATADIAAGLTRAEDELASIDAGGLGAEPARYRALAEGLKALPAKPEIQRLVQVDLVKESPLATLGGAVLDEIVKGVELVRRLQPAPRPGDVAAFVEAFRERYEEREIALVDALDEESGIGFPAHRADGDGGSPLLRDLPFPDADEATVTWGDRERTLLRRLAEALASGEKEIRLVSSDVEALAAKAPPPPPDAFAAMAEVAAASQHALSSGDFRVRIQAFSGPSGAVLLGRFCHADHELRGLVEEHLRAEESLDPDAVFAEIVHLPEGRIGNILLRPVVRGYEIPFLGDSGVPEDRRIPVTDLFVRVRGDRVELRSRRLGRRVIPRLTSAHNFGRRSLGLYRFLCSLQGQGTGSALGWSWGALEDAPFLPRVVHGRLVLSNARWNVVKDELKRLGEARGAARFRRVQEWRAVRGLPRFVVVADADNELPIDLDSGLSVESFVHLVKGRDGARLDELFPAPDQMCAFGPEGRYVHELVVPFVRVREKAAARETARAVSPDRGPETPRVARTHPPGSEWLYAKLYTGESTADRLILESLAPVARKAIASGAADRWFFIRYSDPRWHVRVRFHGDPARLHDEVLPALLGTTAEVLEGGAAWKAQLDTYEREVERYGGPEGIVLAERIFHADSEAVLDLLELLEEGEEGADERWRMAVAGIDALLDDLRLDPEAKRRVIGEVRKSFGTEHREDAALKRALGERYRKESTELARLRGAANLADHPLALGFEVLKRRSERLAPIVEELRGLERGGRLHQSVAALAPSFIHMYANRLLRSTHRRQELVLYDLLARLYATEAARGGVTGRTPPSREDSSR